jgi:hypothetical protein
VIRRAVEWVAGAFLWPFQALFTRWDSYSVLHDWAGAVAGDETDSSHKNESYDPGRTGGTDITNPGPLATTGNGSQQSRADR